MPIPKLRDIFKGGAEGVLKGALDGAANIITKFKADPTKSMEAEKELEMLRINTGVELEKISLQFEQEATKQIQAEQEAVTGRWQSDMSSDSWLSKNARPLIVLGLTVLTYITMVIDSTKVDFDVKESYISLQEILLLTVYAAYFGGRTIEKYQAIRKR